jgi:glycosyltransferase involved in cell wall biosynthesis
MGTNSSGTPELLHHGTCGLLVDPDDTIEWALAMEKLAQNGDDIREMSMRAKERFNAHYSKDASLTGMINIVEQLIDSTR